jgi:membrane-associated phospholipid phosphatase
MKFRWEAWLSFSLLTLISASAAPAASADPRPQSTAAPAPAATTSSSRESAPNEAPPKPAPKQHDFSETQYDERNKHLALRAIERFAGDQRDIWTSPTKLRVADADWLMPLGLASAAFFATDTETSKHLSNSPHRLNLANNFSNAGVGAFGAFVGGMYIWGTISHDDHKSETGFLAAEAAVNSLAVTYALKYSLGRERPLTDNYRGNFWSGGDSFPSEHAALAWSMASVVAHEYPGIFTQILAYGGATAVSLARVDAKQHFPSDVLIGSAIGWLSGEIVYRAHHDSELGGSPWQSYSEALDYLEQDRPRRNMGTTFVELDSWVYPAMDRLGGLGYIHSGIQGTRPWTRMQCALLTVEAGNALIEFDHRGDGALALVERLRTEFSYELERIDGGRNFTAALDSVYARTVSISGPDLTDGFHFGQTIAYDFGRPFERGTNLQDGGSFRADAGPIAIYVRAEYQHAPGAPAPSDAVRSFIAQADLVTEPGANPVKPINRAELLDAYLAVNLSNWQISAGRQSLNWGPGPGGSLIWSNNASPVDMVRIVNSEPEVMPGLLKYFGPVTLDSFFGRLTGGYYNGRPFMYGNKISFKPLPSLEFGYSHTVTIGGRNGNPLTPANFVDSFAGIESRSIAGSSVPGDAHADFDWTWNVPKTGNYFVFYGDWYADDDAFPPVAPTRTAFRPGLYVTHFPHFAKLDLHLEAANTAVAQVGKGIATTGNLNYWNFVYRDGYTNDGVLLGNVVGRMGANYSAWLTYWASKRDTFQFTYKNSQVDKAFVPGGGAFQDYGVNNELHLRSGLYVKSQFQYEHISHFPILFNGPQHNFAATLEIGFLPSKREK